jgi:dephospho-CoA kinase
MLILRRVAITGGIASGKSAVTSFFQKLGAYTVSADQIVHNLLSSNTEIQHQVIDLLGNEIVTDGCIDRKKVASAVFSEPKLLHKLEELLFPLVDREIEKAWEEAAKTKKYPLFVAEVPLLFEAQQEGSYDATIAVVSSDEECQRRFTQGIEEYTRRKKMQLSQAEKAKKAKFIIENTGSLEELEAKVASLFQLLSKGEHLDV